MTITETPTTTWDKAKIEELVRATVVPMSEDIVRKALTPRDGPPAPPSPGSPPDAGTPAPPPMAEVLMTLVSPAMTEKMMATATTVFTTRAPALAVESARRVFADEGAALITPLVRTATDAARGPVAFAQFKVGGSAVAPVLRATLTLDSTGKTAWVVSVLSLTARVQNAVGKFQPVRIVRLAQRGPNVWEIGFEFDAPTGALVNAANALQLDIDLNRSFAKDSTVNPPAELPLSGVMEQLGTRYIGAYSVPI